MARKTRRTSALPRALLALVAVAALLFLGGEAWVLARSGSGQVALARWGLRDRARVVPLLAREIRAGLGALGVPADSIHEAELPRDGGPQRWRVALPPGASSLQANYAVSRRIEELGGVVLGGREAPGPNGATRLTLRLGLPGHALVEMLVVIMIIALLAAALLLTLGGILKYDVFAFLFSTAFLLAVSLAVNWLFAKVFKVIG